MVQEAFKKQQLSSHEYYQAKRWEGKPLTFKLRYFVSNYPEIAFAAAALIIAPCIAYYKYYSFKGSKREAIAKYKTVYKVVRDDDPNIAEIIREKELGREFFPK